MRKIAAFLVYLLAFAVIIAMGGLFLGYWVSNGERNLSYVYVGDVNVSGKTRDETEEILRSNGWGDRETTPLTVTTFRGEQFRVDPSLWWTAPRPSALTWSRSPTSSPLGTSISIRLT